ncbi:MAG: cytochrome c peroxidase [Pseudomonadota bacterium]
MNHGIFDVLVFGLGAVMAGVLLLLAMVHLELGPTVRLAGRKRWLLAAALGSGVLAFVIKLLIIVTLINFPQYTIAPLLASNVPAPRAAPAPVMSGRPHYVWLALDKRYRSSAAAATQPGYRWQALPEQAPMPPHNPATPAKVALGRQLFFDPALSRDGTVSCASCHDVDGMAGTDGRATSRGIDGHIGNRNAPTVWNAAFQSLLFWDGRAASLEEQARGPLLNPLEMGMPSPAAVEERVRSRMQYRDAFAVAFGAAAPITLDRIVEAIAAYERTLITPDSAYDRFVRGEPGALTPAQLRGMALFQSFGCITCHHGPNFSAASVFDDSTPRRIFPANPTPYEQRYDLISDGGANGTAGRGVWRVPSLRNVALTGPWLHNGAVTELAEVVRIMAGAQLGRAGHYLLWSEQEGRLREIDQPAPSEAEVADIVAFLHALSSERLVAGRRAADTLPTRGEGG